MLIWVQALEPLVVLEDLEALRTAAAHLQVEVKALADRIPIHLMRDIPIPRAHQPILPGDRLDSVLVCLQLHPIDNIGVAVGSNMKTDFVEITLAFGIEMITFDRPSPAAVQALLRVAILEDPEAPLAEITDLDRREEAAAVLAPNHLVRNTTVHGTNDKVRREDRWSFGPLLRDLPCASIRLLHLLGLLCGGLRLLLLPSSELRFRRLDRLLVLRNKLLLIVGRLLQGLLERFPTAAAV
mmetsp:Transcript_22853/g.46493  ORF Transcript_22853/g.46493 Transcript_22853/m.46493 type:complete len:240 (+) Transcript_22853:961-1680(+)